MMQKTLKKILNNLEPPYNLSLYSKTVGESLPDDFIETLNNFIEDSLREGNLEENIKSIEGLNTFLSYRSETLVSLLNDYINQYIDTCDSDTDKVEEFKEKVSTYLNVFPTLIPLSQENAKKMESLVYLGWHEKYEEFDFCHKKMKLNYIQRKSNLAVSYFGGRIDSKIFNTLMETGFDFLKDNEIIVLDSHNNSQTYPNRNKHFVNFIGECEDRNSLADVEYIKASPYFKDENWKEWDINTLEHPAFQKRVMFIDASLEGLAEQKESYQHSFDFLEYVKEHYKEELDSIKVKMNYQEDGVLALREYLEKSLHEGIKNEFKIKATLEKSLSKNEKLRRF